ncbi:predicted protein [Histoplasma capsulatum G186AR]|uniref:Uncharacterized protein n=1 Tax=Ajellomyces capsulatus (strain G186AR / H82 / ATCC MYA-2454 / RMSCC 2432) TaxID=447093 RepID=C0NB54_AJECG|nr:uncharacterized protein HCBG_00350 [Histoplasma capsulatum G186AR]EEH10895.1 predicted protein [Histoplasma capsulatum G186AR]
MTFSQGELDYVREHLRRSIVAVYYDGGGLYFEMRKELLIFVSSPRVTPRIRCIISLWGIADRSIAGSIYRHLSQSSPEIAVLVSRFYRLLIKHPTKADWIPCMIRPDSNLYLRTVYFGQSELCYRYIPEPICVGSRVAKDFIDIDILKMTCAGQAPPLEMAIVTKTFDD